MPIGDIFLVLVGVIFLLPLSIYVVLCGGGIILCMAGFLWEGVLLMLGEIWKGLLRSSRKKVAPTPVLDIPTRVQPVRLPQVEPPLTRARSQAQPISRNLGALKEVSKEASEEASKDTPREDKTRFDLIDLE